MGTSLVRRTRMAWPLPGPPQQPSSRSGLTIGRIMIAIAILALPLEYLLVVTGSLLAAFAILALFAACICLYTRTGPSLPTRTQEADERRKLDGLSCLGPQQGLESEPGRNPSRAEPPIPDVA